MKVDGKLKLYSEQLMNDIRKGTPGALEIAGNDVISKAKDFAPWDTGDLKKSINMRSIHGDVLVGTPLNYAIYQEYGTRFQNGKPFMRPALDVVTKGTASENSMARYLTQNIKNRKARLS